MRFLALAVSCLFLGFTSLSAASTDSKGHFDFVVKDAGGGCVQIEEAMGLNGFPMIETDDGPKRVGTITFHFSDVSAGSIVIQSPRYYVTVETDDQGNMSLSPSKLCSLTGVGVRYFKYALHTEDYEFLEFMPHEDFDNGRHRVDIH